MNPFLRRRLPALTFGVLLLVVGGIILGPPLLERIGSILQTKQRGNADSEALSAWRTTGNSAIQGEIKTDPGGNAAACTASGGKAGDFARVDFTSILGYDYSGVAGDGGWDLLNQRSMVHYKGTPAPGQKGNMIIAFHREPNYEHIDNLVVNGNVTVEDKSCHSYVYTITQRWELSPNDVSQLNPTTGYDITMVTCTPFWQDYNRYVWRGKLTRVDGQPFHPPS